MKKLLLLLALLTATPSLATRSVWINGSLVVPNSTRYWAVMGSRTATSSTEILCQSPSDQTIIDLGANLRTSPPANSGTGCTGAGTPFACCTGVGTGTCPTSRTITFRHGATIATIVDTALSITYVSGESGIKHTTSPLAVAAGDLVSLKTTATTNPGNAFIDTAITVDGETMGESFLCGSVAATVTGKPDNISLSGRSDGFCGTADTNCDTVVSTAGRFRKLHCSLPTAPGTDNSCAFTLNDFGSDTALTLTISNDETEGSDLVNDVAVAVGNPINITVDCDVEIVVDILPSCSVAFKADIPGLFLLPYSPHNTNLSTTATQYIPLWGALSTPNTTETNRQQLVSGLLIKGMRARSKAAPGIGASEQFSLRDDVADAGTVCTISGTNKTCTGTTESTVAVDSLIATKVVPSVIPPPAASRAAVTYTARIEGEIIPVQEFDP